MDTLTKSWDRTKERHARRNRLKRTNVFCGTPFGQKVTAEIFLEPLAKHLAGNGVDEAGNAVVPPPPPGNLGSLVYQLNSETLALIALAPLLDGIMRGWDGRDTNSADMLLKIKMGKYLHAKLADKGLLTSDDKAGGQFSKSDWTSSDYVEAGNWLLDVTFPLSLFCYDEDNRAISPEWQEDIGRIYADMLRREPVLLPFKSPPPDWTGPIAKYDDRFQRKFVRDWRPETKKLIAEAFVKGSIAEHVRGVNALQRVPLLIDQLILDLVKEFAVTVMKIKGHNGKQLVRDDYLIKADIADAEWLGDEPFWLGYSCDKRGRIYANSHLNFQREDHCRALFKFANGRRLDAGAIDWLEIHCANSEGTTDKESKATRIRWVRDNTSKIRRIADDPRATFVRASKPFAFLASCIELAGAWDDPEGFVSHLPLSFDGSCNGVQHLTLIIRDADTAARVNLVPSDIPQDVYADIIDRVTAALKTDLKCAIRTGFKKDTKTGLKISFEIDDSKPATFWLNKFHSPKLTRKLLKQPATTFAYSATNLGMQEQITKVYKELFENLEPKDAAGRYLARKIRAAAEALLREEAKVMRYIRKVALHRANQGRFLEWTSPSGFPCCNRYNLPNEKIISLREDGVRVRHKVADGVKKIRKGKCLNAAAPNFVHSLDASHLIKTVNGAVEKDITDILTVHDSFACLAAQAEKFNGTIRMELAMMYLTCDPLGDLHRRNIGNARILPPPPQGQFNPVEIIDRGTYCWM